MPLLCALIISKSIYVLLVSRILERTLHHSYIIFVVFKLSLYEMSSPNPIYEQYIPVMGVMTYIW